MSGDPRGRGTLILAVVLVASPAFADETITAIGSVHCFDGTTGAVRPLEGIRVELVDSDCDGSQICDDVMGMSTAGVGGTFKVTGSGGDPFGGKPDVYLRFVYNDDQGVRLTDELDHTRSFSTPEHDHDNVGSGVIDFGAWTTGVGAASGEGTRCGVWRATRAAYHGYANEVGAEAPAGHLDVLYWSAIWAGTPWTNTDTIHWPIHYETGAAPHEFGHSIRHAADGDGAHFTNDVTRFRYARTHSACAADANAQSGESRDSVRGFGFNEGWAEYWEGATGGCPGTADDAIEGDIARALRALQTSSSLSRRDMVRVLIDNPGAIHNLDEFKSAMASRLGVAVSSLRTEGAGAAAASAYVRELSAEQIRATLGRQLAEVRTLIEEQRAAAREAARRNEINRRQTCTGADCEAIFRSTVAPALLEAEARSLEALAVRLEQALASARPLSAEIAGGAFDSWLREYRSALDTELRRAMQEGVARAQAAFARLGPRLSHFADPFAAELAEAGRRLDASRPAKDDREPGLPQLVLTEDRPRR